jgi:C4-dicarboxylate-specific signal transduction histidine kinase
MYFLKLIHRKEIHNINLHQAQELALIQSAKLASVEEMTAGIAHEVNNPLMIIQGYTEEIICDIDGEKLDNAKLKSHLEKINDRISRIATIIKSLKNLGNQTDVESLDVHEVSGLIKESIELCHSNLYSKGIELKTSNIDLNSKINCRPVEVTQVIINLLNNSVDAIKDKKDPWIEVRLSEVNDKVRVEVIDCGNGIDKNIAEKMMNPFFTTKPVGKGTGLGLSISERLISEQFGKLYLDESNKNTSFVIEFHKVT